MTPEKFAYRQERTGAEVVGAVHIPDRFLAGDFMLPDQVHFAIQICHGEAVDNAAKIAEAHHFPVGVGLVGEGCRRRRGGLIGGRDRIHLPQPICARGAVAGEDLGLVGGGAEQVDDGRRLGARGERRPGDGGTGAGRQREEKARQYEQG